MGDVGCSSGGVGSTGEDRRNGSSSLVKQDVVGDGSEATWSNQVEPLNPSIMLSNLLSPSLLVGVVLQAQNSHLIGT